MTKRIIFVVISILLLVLPLISCGKDTDVPDGMIKASKTEFYTMFVPENWYVVETNSDATLAQSKVDVLGTTELEPVTVNAMFWSIDQSLWGEDKQAEAQAEFYKKYQEDMKGTFADFTHIETKDSGYYTGAKEYTFGAKYGDIYYKYNMTVIIHNQIYYVITFNFPQSNLKRDADGKITPSESFEAAEFEDSKYADEIESVISNFKPEK